jgi:hypothetical protein
LDAKDTSGHSSKSLDTVDTALPDSTKGGVTGSPDTTPRLHECTGDVSAFDTDSTVGKFDKHVDKVEAIVIGADRTKR